MIDVNYFNPALVNSELLEMEVPRLQIFAELESKKRGPVRVLRNSKINWEQLERIQPHQESALHD